MNDPRMAHSMEARQSPLQFIETPTLIQPPNSLYGSASPSNPNYPPPSPGIGALSSRLQQLRPSSGVLVSAAVQGGRSTASLPLQMQQRPATVMNHSISGGSSQQLSYLQQPAGMVSNLQNRSSSVQSIQAIMRDRSMDNLGMGGGPGIGLGQVSRMESLDRPRPASARGQPYGDILDNVGGNRRFIESTSSPRTGSLERSHLAAGTRGNAGIARIKHQRSQSFDYNLEKEGFGEMSVVAQAPPQMALPLTGPMPPPTGATYPHPLIPTMHPLSQPIVFPGDKAMESILFDYQAEMSALNRECARLQQELEMTKEKMASYMNSIKTFWSPELKRERAMRKEENSKYAILADHLHQLQLEKQTMLSTLHNFETELRKERDLRSKQAHTGQEFDLLRQRCDELTKENRQLSKQSEEGERRLAGQKAGLANAEESIRRLVEVVKAVKSGQAVRVDRLEEDRGEIERLRVQISDYSQRCREADRVLIERDFELAQLKEELDSLMQEIRMLKAENEQLRQDTRQTQTLQSLVDTKESKILTLENEIRLLEDEIARLRDDGIVTPTTSTSSGIEDFDKTLQSFRSNERLLKSKIEMLA